jgi:ATP-dependent RNA helicase SUPV3L1/SUV3
MTPGRVTALLGPTNTGKTHHAIERLVAHRSGIIGLPLRLLAREVYERVLRLRGPSVTALVTGEERIVPERPRYWICTTEAMPEGMGVDFLAVDEIQLCADPERGHVFTDRLLNARGLHETLFLGSATMRNAIAALVPGVQFQTRERLSTLSYAGPRKIARLPERSAIVGFSAEGVYAIAEYIRRTRGGAAVVLGALSPRTRNAQVALYQKGEVDFLVATDAIGMGLNLDVAHVAFAGLSKFDGHRMRRLEADELAQIAGRAGRHSQDGSFGVTGEAPDLDPETVAAIEAHSFRPVTRLMWRNARLQFGSVGRLIQSLEEPTSNPWLGRVRESDDLAALRQLGADPEIAARAAAGPAVRLLWDVCRIPNFRGLSRPEHAALLREVFVHLHERGRVPADWLGERVRRLDRGDGDIDAISRRLAFIRTWTYVAQRPAWVADEGYWRDETRKVEDRLSDALHQALTERFVDRRTSTLARRLRQREVLVAEVDDKGAVTVEGHEAGRLEGFRFRLAPTATPDAARTLRQAAAQALLPQFALRADRFYNAPDTELDVTEQGGLMWGEHAVGRLGKGPEALRPEILAFVDEEAGEAVAEKVRRRLQHFIDRRLQASMEPLLALMRDEALQGLAKGFAYRLVENLGIIPRGDVAEEVRALDPEARAGLRRHGVRLGQFTVFLPALLKPAPTRLRLVLWSLWKGLEEFPAAPPPGHVTVPAGPGQPPGFWPMAGYRAAGDRAIRIDMLERLADMLRERDSRAGFEATPEMLSITGLSLEQFARLMEGLGYRAQRGERPKARRPRPEPAAAVPAGPAAVAPEPPEAPPAPAAAPDPTPAEPTSELPRKAPVAAPIEAPGEAPAEAPLGVSAEAPGAPPAAEMPGASGPGAEAAALAVETEVFFTFTWGRREGRRDGRHRPGAEPGPEHRTERRPESKPGRGGGAPRPRGEPRDRPAGERQGARPHRRENAGEGGGLRPGRPDQPRRIDTEATPEARAPEFHAPASRAPASRGPEGARHSRRDPEGNRLRGRDGKRDGNRDGGRDGDRDRDQPRGGPRPGGPEPRPEPRPARDRPIDPDNPFAAALMGFKTK